jgi:hypothetical protein
MDLGSPIKRFRDPIRTGSGGGTLSNIERGAWSIAAIRGAVQL